MVTQVNERKIDTLLARFFSESAVRSFIKNGSSSTSLLREFYYSLNQLNIDFDGRTYKDLFEFAYGHLLKNYRNEYIYKNAIANKILLGKHNLNTSFMLQEFRIGGCKADTLVLNGTSNVYEIKTELDSLDRLQKQIATYLQAFDMVHVITFPGQSVKIKKFVPSCIGIMELGRNNKISTIREAKSGKRAISTALLFDSLRRKEYRAVIKEYYGFVPEVPNTKEYQSCKELFVQIKPETAHDLSIIQLKKRGDGISLKEFVCSVPDYFKSLSLRGKFSEKEAGQIKKLLNSELCAA